MKQTDIKSIFEQYGLFDCYAEILKKLGRESVYGDDIADIIFQMRSSDDERLPDICRAAKEIDKSSYFDPVKYLMVQYEAEGRYLGNAERIGLLSEMCSYGYERAYVTELACLYLEEGNKMKARRLLINAASGFDEFPEKDVLLDDIKNGTDNYRQYLRSAERTEQQLKNDEMFVPLRYDSSVDNDEGIPEFILNKFREKHLIGMYSVKKQLARIYNRMEIERKRLEKLNITQAEKPVMNFILMGNPGTGKTSVARIIGELFFQMGLLSSSEMIEVDRSGLVDQYIGGTDKTTSEVLNKSLGKTLFIDEAYTLYEEGSDTDNGREAINAILKFVEDHRGELCVIMAGYRKEMKEMMKKANRGFSSRFNTQIDIPDYSETELLNIIITMANAKSYSISADAKSIILEQIERENIDATFDNARFMRRLCEDAIMNQSERLVNAKSEPSENDLRYLLKEDFISDARNDKEETLESCLAELNSLIGLEGVKEQVKVMISEAKVMEEKRKRGIKNSGTGSLHMIFTGNPGTGKTTVARLIGKIYNHLGLLKRKDVFVECSRANLVGKYMGHTAKAVDDAVDSALGGVLFIDEAYNLKNSEQDYFGDEAINELVAQMENNRENLLVVIAGYTNEIKEFLSSNPGLKSRFATEIHFEDYSVEEMADIFVLIANNKHFSTDKLSREAIINYIDANCHEKDFGNGRGVRNLCERAIRNHNKNLESKDLSKLSGEELSALTEADLK